MTIIDISVPVTDRIPVWPGSHGFSQIQRNLISNGCQSNVTVIDMDIHVGTHIDAPFHFLMEGKTIDKIPLNELCGDSFVLDARNKAIISETVLMEGNIPQNTSRLLIKTNNGSWWKQTSFNPSYVGLSVSGAQWLVDHGIELVGIDYLSVASFDDIQSVHEILLNKDVIIIEGLDLTEPNQGMYELNCLPLKMMNADGAPARATLRVLNK
ncbi:cyclase family protein [Caldithrix abyssi]|nr:cyclase family protein [Caldithrix abyssi]